MGSAGTQPNKGYPGRGCAKVYPAAGGVTSLAVAFSKSVGHLRDASENPAAQAAPDCAAALKLGEAPMLGGTHTNPRWTKNFLWNNEGVALGYG